MKYGYGNYDNFKNIIKEYKNKDDKIIVTYLDDSTCIKPFSKSNEEDIISTMIKQAQDRSKSSMLNDAKKERNGYIATFGACAVTSIIFFTSAFTQPELIMKIINSVSAGAVSFVTISTICVAKPLINELIDEIHELKKYNIYLSMKPKLENTTEININNLDNYSLKDLKKIKNNLENFKNSVKGPTLVKKRDL